MFVFNFLLSFFFTFVFVHLTGAPTTPPPCVDQLNNCKAYGSNICSDPKYTGWVADNCRYFCRQCTGKLACRWLSPIESYTLIPSGDLRLTVDEMTAHRKVIRNI